MPAGRRNSLQLQLCKADLPRWAFGQLIWLQMEPELLTLACEALLGELGLDNVSLLDEAGMAA